MPWAIRSRHTSRRYGFVPPRATVLLRPLQCAEPGAYRTAPLEEIVLLSGERLLGFSAREMWLTPGAVWVGDVLDRVGWNENRKKRHLLREDVKRPLSTDYLVWPTVFDLYESRQLSGPTHEGSIQDLWSNLDELERCLRSRRTPASQHCWIIGVTVIADVNDTDKARMSSIAKSPTEPPMVSETWKFLGYDVSDRWLLSGVSNCLHNGMPEFRELKAQWKTCLNSFHLFTDLCDATGFKTVIDQVVQRHAPFSVFGLWRIEEYGIRAIN